MRVSLRILTLLVALLAALPSMLHAQTAEEKARIAEQRKLIEQLEKQVEEEESARDIIDQLRMIDCNKLGLYMIDKEMAARVYSTPSPLVKE